MCSAGWDGRSTRLVASAQSRGPRRQSARAITAALEDPNFRWLAETYALTPFQIAVRIIVLAPKLDLKYERLCVYLQDDVGKMRPGVNLILGLLCPDRTSRASSLVEFVPGASSVGNRLIAVMRNAAAQILSAPAHLDEQMISVLLRLEQLDSRLTGFCRVSAGSTDLFDLLIAAEWRRVLPPLLKTARDKQLCQPLLPITTDITIGCYTSEIDAALAHPAAEGTLDRTRLRPNGDPLLRAARRPTRMTPSPTPSSVPVRAP
jgi:hypothetical protein